MAKNCISKEDMIDDITKELEEVDETIPESYKNINKRFFTSK